MCLSASVYYFGLSVGLSVCQRRCCYLLPFSLPSYVCLSVCQLVGRSVSVVLASRSAVLGSTVCSVGEWCSCHSVCVFVCFCCMCHYCFACWSVVLAVSLRFACIIMFSLVFLVLFWSCCCSCYLLSVCLSVGVYVAVLVALL